MTFFCFAILGSFLLFSDSKGQLVFYHRLVSHNDRNSASTHATSSMFDRVCFVFCYSSVFNFEFVSQLDVQDNFRSVLPSV